ncbi:MAG TPA: SH3 domain-containing protein [Mycobacteriales bacterium]
MQLRLVRRVVATLGTITLLSAGLFTSDAAMASSPDSAPAPAAAATSSSPYGHLAAGRSAAATDPTPDLVSSSSCGTGRIAVSSPFDTLFVRSAPNTSAPMVTTPAPNGAQFDCIAVVPGEPYTVCGVTGNGWMLIPLFGRPPTDVGFAPASCFVDV